MKKILEQLYQHQTLSQQSAYQLLMDISAGKYNPSEIAAFLSVYNFRQITMDELLGFRTAMRDQALDIQLDVNEAIDVCGTGGDGKNTFNISTLAAFVIAGAGYKVCKHGNYGVSSISGSSNVLEALGIHFSNNEDQLNHQLQHSNICFLHAPLFNPSMKVVAPIRKELGIKTFFNHLGPLCNPARPKYQLMGVSNRSLLRMYQYVLQSEHQHFSLVHSIDGYDEISLTDKAIVVNHKVVQSFSPHDFSNMKITQKDVYGGDSLAENTKIFMELLSGGGTKAQQEIIVANTAVAIQTIQPEMALNECISYARESLISKKALAIFNRLKSLQ